MDLGRRTWVDGSGSTDLGYRYRADDVLPEHYEEYGKGYEGYVRPRCVLM